MLISEVHNFIDSKELERSINETFQTLSGATIECQYEFHTNDQICTNNAIIIYDFLHSTIDKEFLKVNKLDTTIKEACFKKINELSVHVSASLTIVNQIVVSKRSNDIKQAVNDLIVLDDYDVLKQIKSGLEKEQRRWSESQD